MRKYAIYLFVVVFSTLLSGCEKNITTQDQSIVTHYVTIDLKGNNSQGQYLLGLGTPYVDPGYVAMEGDEDVTDNVKVTGEVNSNKPGFYTLNYSAVNKDGFSKSVSRTVIVYDPNNTMEVAGDYTSDVTRRAPYDNAFSGLSVSMSKFLPGIFHVSDLLGGYYSLGYDYGDDYAMTGYIQVNEDNSIELLSSHIKGWGDSLDGMTNGIYDPITNQITFTVMYAGKYTFDVTLKLAN